MNYTFNSIAGYETEKKELEKLCKIFNNLKNYEEKGAKLPKGIIFYGEPGTGKTLFSKVMANVCGLEVLKIDLGDVKNESAICKYIKKTFVKASKSKEPVMIFFDEMDKVLPNDEEEYYTDRSKTILTQLLTLIDVMDSAGNVVFVATCNYYDLLPETLTRPGRLDKKIGLSRPNYFSRVEILNMYAKKSSCRFELPMEETAKLCTGFSCSALETLINECILQSDESGFISEQLMQEHIFEIKNEDIPRKTSKVDDMVFACRNVGAFIVAKTFNVGESVLSLSVDSVCNKFFNNIISYFDDDYDDDCELEDDLFLSNDSFNKQEDNEERVSTRYYSKSDLINTITVLLGGYVAEELILHKIYDNVSFYLLIIDEILFALAKNGMLGLDLLYRSQRSEELPYSCERVERLNQVFDEIVQDCYKKAKTIITNNKDLAEKLISTLSEKKVLKEAESKLLLTEFGGIKV